MIAPPKKNQSSLLDPFLNAFTSLSKNEPQENPSWLASLRQTAMGRFAASGFPTSRDENWKYTSVLPIMNTSYKFRAKTQPAISSAIMSSMKIDPSWPTFVFVNGCYSPQESKEGSLFPSIKVGNLRKWILQEPDLVKTCLNLDPSFKHNSFGDLNTSLFEDGGFIFIPKGVSIEKPIHLIFIVSPSQEPLICFPKTLILLEEGSLASVVESHVSLGHEQSFSNAMTHVILKKNARLDYYQILNGKGFHIHKTESILNEKSSLSHSALIWKSKFARNNLDVLIQGKGSDLELNGLYLTLQEDHVDNTTVIDHAVGESTSRQLYKGILNGKSTGVFSGKIFVRPHAQKTNAQQTNKNLLLSEKAKINTLPQLEILANDVKCTHGSAVGELDDLVLFYLKSRGIGLEKARCLLSYGFANEVVEKLKLEPIRKKLEQHLLSQFEAPPEKARA